MHLPPIQLYVARVRRGVVHGAFHDDGCDVEVVRVGEVDHLRPQMSRTDVRHYHVSILQCTQTNVLHKEGRTISFNDVLNTFYLHGVRHNCIVNKHAVK